MTPAENNSTKVLLYLRIIIAVGAILSAIVGAAMYLYDMAARLKYCEEGVKALLSSPH